MIWPLTRVLLVTLPLRTSKWFHLYNKGNWCQWVANHFCHINFSFLWKDRKRTLPKRSLTIATASVFSFCPRTLYFLVASWNVLILHCLIGFSNFDGSSLHSLMNPSHAVSPILWTLTNDVFISLVIYCATARPGEMLNSSFSSRLAENRSIFPSIAVIICGTSSEFFFIFLLWRLSDVSSFFVMPIGSNKCEIMLVPKLWLYAHLCRVEIELVSAIIPLFWDCSVQRNSWLILAGSK